MKTAIFEYGKQSLAEWIEQNHDCEKMVLVGEVHCDLWDDNFKVKAKGQNGGYRYQREPNIGWHSFDLLYGFDSIAKDFHPLEFDITNMHLLDYEGEIDDEELSDDAYEEQPSQIYQMLANRKYGTRFIRKGDFMTTPDGKVLIHCDSIKDTIIIPDGIETIGRLAFASIVKPEFRVILPDGIKNIEECAFAMSDGLVDINFPDSLQYLGESAFCGTGLEEVLLPDGIEEIPCGCFQYVYIERLRLPANLKTIGDCAFVGLECEEVRLPKSVESVGHWSLGIEYYTICKIYIPKTIKELPHDFYYEEGIDFSFEERKPQIEYY